jgi:acetyl-CoA carboxylase biotin carboxyl carrier protein
MNLRELKELIDIVTSKDSIEELEIERSGFRFKIKRASMAARAASAAAAALVTTSAAPAIPTEALPAEVSEENGLFYARAPIVGTFYMAPSPAAEPFVLPGDLVEKGTVLCIIEAMKLMNEIESEVAGEIVQVLVENGQPVEYGEKLFAIRTR